MHGVHPYAGHGNAMRPYQFYHLSDMPIRQPYARMYHDLMAKD